MEDEIKINEYVRTRAGHIYKITNIDENGLIYWNKIQCGWSKQQLEDIIVKHSKQLIDLIDFGDFVNGIKVVSKGLDKNDNISSFSNGHDEVREKDIKAILTKERFEANCYKVGGLYGRNQ